MADQGAMGLQRGREQTSEGEARYCVMQRRHVHQDMFEILLRDPICIKDGSKSTWTLGWMTWRRKLK